MIINANNLILQRIFLVFKHFFSFSYYKEMSARKNTDLNTPTDETQTPVENTKTALEPEPPSSQQIGGISTAVNIIDKIFKNTNVVEKPKVSFDTVPLDLSMPIERCYAINEDVYACVQVKLTTRTGLSFSQQTTSLLKPEELPSNLKCTNVLSNKNGSITAASVCVANENDVSMATDTLFNKFIPTIYSKLHKP